VISAGCMRADSGAVTAEFAVVLPAVIVVALVLLSLGRAVVARVECQDAARAGAKEIAVAEVVDAAATTRARAAAIAVSSQGKVTFSQSSSSVKVSVECPLLPGPLGIFPAHVGGVAVAIKQGGQ
jgi:Flp pilus assembly protein TadG